MKTFKLVIAGGGSTYTPVIVKSLLVQKDRFKLNELVQYDNNAERQEAVGVIGRHVVKNALDRSCPFSAAQNNIAVKYMLFYHFLEQWFFLNILH